MRQLIQNTNKLTTAKISQTQLKVGTNLGSEIGIYFNNGSENIPGIKFDANTKMWQYSLDGIIWNEITNKPKEINYEIISIKNTNLVNGIATIKHNLGQKYVLGLDYTVTPDAINYVDENTLTLDYSKHISNISTTAADSYSNGDSNIPDLILSEAGTAEINQKYIFKTDGTYYDMAGSSKNCSDTINGGVWFSEDEKYILYARSLANDQFEYDITDNNNYVKTPYYASSILSDTSVMPWNATWQKSARGTLPVPLFNQAPTEIEITKIWFAESKQSMLQ